MKPIPSTMDAFHSRLAAGCARLAAVSLLLLFALLLPVAPARAQVKPMPGAAAPANGQGAAVTPAEDREREGAEFLKRRQRWFYQQRAYPLGFIPQGARARALEQLRQMHNSQRRALGLPPLPAQTTQIAGTSTSSGGQVAIISGNAGGGFVVPPSGTGAAWLPIGPQATSSTFNSPFTSGRVTAIASDPRDATGKTVYIGGADGGVWKTTDAGATWTPLFDYQPLVSIGSIVLDPATNPSTIYVGTGEDNYGGDNVYGAGVYKSIDGGSTWTRDSTFGAPASPSPLDNNRQGPMIGNLAVNPVSLKNNILLAGVRGRGLALQSGLWCSADSGATWAHVLPVMQPTDTAGDPPTGIVFDSTGVAYVALGFPFGESRNGIYKSSAAITSCSGIIFNKLTMPGTINTANLGRIALAIAPSNNTTLYAAIADSSGSSSKLLGVIKTTDGGTTWAKLTGSTLLTTSGFCNDQCFYDIVLAVHPTDPNTVYAGGSAKNATLIRSTDGGSTWTEISRAAFSDGLHVDMHAIAFAKTSATPTFSLYAGNDGGVWSSGTNDPKGTVGLNYWSNLNGPLNITQFYPGISIHPSTPAFALGGAQDNGVQIYNGPSLTWTDSGLGCDGGMTAIDPQTPTTSYSECEYLPDPNGVLLIGIAYSGDGMFGNGFVGTTGITSTDRGNFIPPLILDKNNPLTLYFGTCRVWQTKDGANSWNAISPDLTSSTHPAGCGSGGASVLTAIAVAPSASSTIYTGADDGEIEATTNSGTAWASLTTGTLPGRVITQIAADPSNSKKAYVTFSGFGSCNNVVVVCDGKGHVFVTADATVAPPVWTDISGAYGALGSLPDIPVNDLVIDPDDSTHSTIYVATDIGAFFTTNASTSGGTTWAPLGAATTLPNSEILSLTLHDPSRTLRAGTHGRGVWDINLGPAANTPSFQISSISPVMAMQGAASIANFTVNGTGFLSGATINFKMGTTTTVLTPSVTSTQLVATLPSAQLAAQGVAQVSVTNPGPATTATVPFVVLGPDFVIVSTGATSKTVKAGVSASFPVSIAALNGFTSSVTMSCSLPVSAKGTTCAVTTPLAVNGNGTVSVTTTVLLPPTAFRPPAGPGFPLPIALASLAIAALLAFSRKQPRLRFALTAACAALLLAAILPLAGCGSGPSAPPPPTNTTPAGTYTVTVTGTSGGITHTTPFTLVVQ
ncbi:MAG: hypothetical protein LAN71_08000 [Acidobacteriia bacterium]|nr:hypothetical protein [Terriglobia bacterium]